MPPLPINRSSSNDEMRFDLSAGNENTVATIDFTSVDDNDLSAFIAGVYNLPFYKALFFTLAYTFVVTPLVIIFGLLIAPHFLMPALTLRGPLNTLYHSGATFLMRWCIRDPSGCNRKCQ